MIEKLLNNYITTYGKKYNYKDLYINLYNYIFNEFYGTNLEVKNINNIINIFGNIKNNGIETIKQINNVRLEYIYTEGKYIKNSFERKKLGIYYTSNEIVNKMISNLIKNHLKNNSNNIKSIKLLDYCCGTGNFSIAFIKYLNNNFNLSFDYIIRNNIVVSDIDLISLHILKLRIIALGYNNLNIINSICINGDHIFDSNKKLINKGINSIISNPPYLSLKINTKNNETDEVKKIIEKEKKNINLKIINLKKSGQYIYSLQGVLNLYKLSLENIINILPDNGIAEIICPSTIFGDITSSKLRLYIFNSGKINNIKYIKEKEKTFDKVTQSLVIFDYIKGRKNNTIKISHNTGNFNINFKDIKSIFLDKMEVPYIDQIGWSILKKLSKHKKLKDFTNIRNKRGELDQTLHKKFITDKKTSYNFVRGSMLGNYKIIYNNEYVLINDFLNKKSNEYKINDFQKYRIVSKNVINIDNKKRINYIFCGKNDILGNSCNYISLKNNSKEELEKLKKILNSKLINWFFKIISSNNHLNNYEVDEFPLINYNNISNFEDKNICKLYGLDEKETKYILNYN